MSALEPVISADSHICEIEACYADIDPKFQDSRPKASFDEHAGAVLEVADLGIKLPMGLVCTGGRPPEDVARKPICLCYSTAALGRPPVSGRLAAGPSPGLAALVGRMEVPAWLGA